jgi:NUMOD1 domain
MTPVLIRGKAYRSVAAASRLLGVNQSTINHHLNAGTIDQVGNRRTPPRQCEFNGVKYPNMQAAAIALGVSREAIRQRLNRIEAKHE